MLRPRTVRLRARFIHSALFFRNLTEKMKNTNQLYWVGMMNNLKNEAEEIVLKELIYV